MRMSPEDRAHLAEDLLQSIQDPEHQRSVDAAWAAEAERRSKAYIASGRQDSVDAFAASKALRAEIIERRLQK